MALRSNIGILFSIFCLVSGLSLATLIVPEEARNVLGAIFANRLVFIPAQIHFIFFREFSDIGFLYWSESKISFGLFESPLDINSVNYIGQIMTGDSKVSANVGWIANGYMNLGEWGIAIYALILGGIMSILDAWAFQAGYALVGSVFMVPLFGIVISSDLLVSMLTGGVFAIMVIFGILLWFSKNNSGAFFQGNMYVS